MAEASPEVVVHELTSLPDRLDFRKFTVTARAQSAATARTRSTTPRASSHRWQPGLP